VFAGSSSPWALAPQGIQSERDGRGIAAPPKDTARVATAPSDGEGAAGGLGPGPGHRPWPLDARAGHPARIQWRRRRARAPSISHRALAPPRGAAVPAAPPPQLRPPLRQLGPGGSEVIKG
jgi:hypothetical protein